MVLAERTPHPARCARHLLPQGEKGSSMPERGCPGHLARRRASRFCPGMTSFVDAGCANEGSELPQQRIAAGHLDLAGRRLEVELLNHAVVDQHRITFGADAKPVAGGIQL